MAQQNSFSPPIASPPETPPRTILQVDTQAETMPWGNIPSVNPKPEGGVPLQASITGRSNAEGGGRR